MSRVRGKSCSAKNTHLGAACIISPTGVCLVSSAEENTKFYNPDRNTRLLCLIMHDVIMMISSTGGK